MPMSTSRVGFGIGLFLITASIALNVGLVRSNLAVRRQYRGYRTQARSLDLLHQAEDEAQGVEQFVLGRDAALLEGLAVNPYDTDSVTHLGRSSTPYRVVLLVPVVGCTTCVAEEVSVLSEVASRCGSTIDVFGLVAPTQGPYFQRLLHVARPSFPFYVVSERADSSLWSAMGAEQSPVVVVIDDTTSKVVSAFCAKPELSHRLDRFRAFLLRLGSQPAPQEI